MRLEDQIKIKDALIRQEISWEVALERMKMDIVGRGRNLVVYAKSCSENREVLILAAFYLYR